MFSLLNSLWSGQDCILRCRRGVAALEFGLLAPLLALVMAGMFDFGYYINQSNNLEKSLRVGAMLAARSELPLNGSSITTIKNLVKTGTTDGSAAYLVPGWADAGANLSVTTATVNSGGTDYEVIRLAASVPYDPFFGGFLETFGFHTITMTAKHEQTYVGN